MKKLSTLLIIAFALVLGLTQCKKKVDTIASPSDLGKTVHITVNVGDGDRHIVYPGTGAVVYTDGDKIYVGDGKKYLGTLTYGSGAFSGTITEPAVGDYLYFYFLGGIEISPVAATTSYEISIANQSSKLPVLSFGRSTSTYTTSSATYGCTLLNKCGLVKFVPATPTTKTVKVGGMKTTAKINFATPGISPTETTGEVTLYSESDAAKWAILLVQDEVSTPPVTIAGYNSTIVSVPAVTENMYYTNGGNGVSIAMEYVLPYIDAEFTVASGTTVKFSKGNLQYDKGTGKFSFMGHQYSTIETKGQDVGDDYANQNIVSLFGWGTSGFNGKYPYMTSTTSSEYGNGNSDIAGTNYDWGFYNKQSNQNKIEGGGNYAWRTLTSAEWAWVLGPDSDANPGTNCRTSSTVNNIQNARFAKATVNSKAGVIIFPDNYTHPSGVTQPTNINGYTSNYTGNSYDATQWSRMESAGAVFLPAAGYREGTSVDEVGSYGRYWSSTYYDNSDYAYVVNFDSSKGNPSDYNRRYRGYSVRLVF